MLPVAEAPPGNHSQQVVEQDEEKNSPEVWQEAVGPVTADRRPGDIVANEKENRLEHIHEPAAADGVRAMWRTTGTMTAMIRTAAITSITMNRVTWTPTNARQGSRSSSSKCGRREPRQLEVGVVDDMVQWVCRVLSHGVSGIAW